MGQQHIADQACNVTTKARYLSVLMRNSHLRTDSVVGSLDLVTIENGAGVETVDVGVAVTLGLVPFIHNYLSASR